MVHRSWKTRRGREHGYYSLVVLISLLSISGVNVWLSVVQAAEPCSLQVTGDIALQSAITNSAPPFSITICQDLAALGVPIKINQRGSISGRCASGPCLIAAGNGVATPLFIVNGGNVTFTNIIFAKGINRDGPGGAVQVTNAMSSITFVDSAFTSNAASNGGAVSSSLTPVQGVASFVRTRFINNSAHSLDGRAQGGAILWTGPLFVRDSEFVNNQADQSGGAIHVDGESNVDIRNSSFSSNFLTSSTFALGGAIRMTRGSATLRVTSSSFKSNVITGPGSLVPPPTFRGGAIYVAAAFLGIANTFRGNSAGAQGTGGAVQLEGSASSICGPNTLEANAAQAGLDYGFSPSAQVTACPALPSNASLSTGTSFAVDCTKCGCASGLCDATATCVGQTPNSSLSCSCNMGYIGDGFFCTASSATIISPGVPPGSPSPSPSTSPTTPVTSQFPPPAPVPLPPAFPPPPSQPPGPGGGGEGGGGLSSSGVKLLAGLLGGCTGFCVSLWGVFKMFAAAYRLRSAKGQLALEVAYRLRNDEDFDLPEDDANDEVRVQRDKQAVIRDLVWDVLSTYDCLGHCRSTSDDNSTTGAGIWYKSYAGHRCEVLITILREIRNGTPEEENPVENLDVVRIWVLGTQQAKEELKERIRWEIEGRAANFRSTERNRGDRVYETLTAKGWCSALAKLCCLSSGVIPIREPDESRRRQQSAHAGEMNGSMHGDGEWESQGSQRVDLLAEVAPGHPAPQNRQQRQSEIQEVLEIEQGRRP